IGTAVSAFGICLLLDHEFATVPACLRWCFTGRAVLLHEAHLALALVVQRVGRAQILLAGRRGKPGARAPVAFEEADVLVLLGFGRHDHRLGWILFLLGHLLVGRLLVLLFWALALILAGVLLVRPLVQALVVRALVVRALLIGLVG